MRVICGWCDAVIAEAGEEEGTSLQTCETCTEERGLYRDGGPEPDPLATPVTDEGLEPGQVAEPAGTEGRQFAGRVRTGPGWAGGG